MRVEIIATEKQLRRLNKKQAAGEELLMVLSKTQKADVKDQLCKTSSPVPPSNSNSFQSIFGETFASFLTDPPQFFDDHINLYEQGLAVQMPFDAEELRKIAIGVSRTQDTTYPGRVVLTLSDKPFDWDAKTKIIMGLGGSIGTGVNTGRAHTESFFPAMPGQIVYLNLRWEVSGQGRVRIYMASREI